MMKPSDLYGDKTMFELAYGYPPPPDAYPSSEPAPTPSKAPARASARTPAASDGASRGHAAVVSRQVLPSGCVLLGVDFARGRNGGAAR